MDVDDVVDLSVPSNKDVLSIHQAAARDLRALTQNSNLTITPAPLQHSIHHQLPVATVATVAAAAVAAVAPASSSSTSFSEHNMFGNYTRFLTILFVFNFQFYLFFNNRATN